MKAIRGKFGVEFATTENKRPLQYTRAFFIYKGATRREKGEGMEQKRKQENTTSRSFRFWRLFV